MYELNVNLPFISRNDRGVLLKGGVVPTEQDGKIFASILHDDVVTIHEGYGESQPSYRISDQEFDSAEACLEYLATLPQTRIRSGILLIHNKVGPQNGIHDSLVDFCLANNIDFFMDWMSSRPNFSGKIPWVVQSTDSIYELHGKLLARQQSDQRTQLTRSPKGWRIGASVPEDSVHKLALRIDEHYEELGAKYRIADRQFESADECLKYLATLPRKKLRYGIHLFVGKRSPPNTISSALIDFCVENDIDCFYHRATGRDDFGKTEWAVRSTDSIYTMEVKEPSFDQRARHILRNQTIQEGAE